jgi:hypothetical protein
LCLSARVRRHQEVHVPQAAHFAAATGGACTSADVLRYELHVLQALHWQVAAELTAASWASLYTHRALAHVDAAAADRAAAAKQGAAARGARARAREAKAAAAARAAVAPAAGARAAPEARALLPPPSAATHAGASSLFERSLTLVDAALYDSAVRAFKPSALAAAAVYLAAEVRATRGAAGRDGHWGERQRASRGGSARSWVRRARALRAVRIEHRAHSCPPLRSPLLARTRAGGSSGGLPARGDRLWAV